MVYIKGHKRDQLVMFPACMDDYVTEDNIVRVIDQFVDVLDLKDLGFKRPTPDNLGAPSYDPADMIKLYIYGYLNNIRSSRTLERETHRNVELMWLLRGLTPDFKTIADFRKDNLQAFKNLFTIFLNFCQETNLLNSKFVAIDGSHFKAVNAQERHFTKNKLEKRLKELHKLTNEYVQELDKIDELEKKTENEALKQTFNKKIEDLRREEIKLSKIKEDIMHSEKDQLCSTDRDCCVMKKGVGYNVQIAVDDKHKLIVTYDVTDHPTDYKQLFLMAKKVNEALKIDSKDKLQVVADKGYYNHAEIKKCLDNQIIPYVSEPLKTGNTGTDQSFSKTNFTYDKENDCYVCPSGSVLKFFEKRKDKRGGIQKTYKCNDLQNCPFKGKCTSSQVARYVSRWEYEDLLDEIKKKSKENNDKLKKRKAIVEHPFGTIKRAMNHGFFLMKGKAKTNAEFALTSLVYNIKRVNNILGTRKFIEAIG